jgi:hypothetical protein
VSKAPVTLARLNKAFIAECAEWLEGLCPWTKNFS